MSSLREPEGFLGASVKLNYVEEHIVRHINFVNDMLRLGFDEETSNKVLASLIEEAWSNRNDLDEDHLCWEIIAAASRGTCELGYLLPHKVSA